MSYHLTTRKSWDETLTDIAEVFRKWGVSAQSWSTQPQRPHKRANQYQSRDERRVTLTFSHHHASVTLVMDKQATAQANLRVLYLVLEALRLNEMRGYAEVYTEATRQLYLAAPAPTPTPASSGDVYAVLCVRTDAPLEVCEAAYRALVKRHHPDSGGSNQAMQALNQAITIIRRERGVAS